MSNDPEELDWESLTHLHRKKIFTEPQHDDGDRIAELQRRNTLCLPHLKSLYPVESLEPHCDEKVLLVDGTRATNTRMTGKRTTADAGLRCISEELILDGTGKVCSVSVIVTIHFSSCVNL